MDVPSSGTGRSEWESPLAEHCLAGRWMAKSTHTWRSATANAFCSRTIWPSVRTVRYTQPTRAYIEESAPGARVSPDYADVLNDGCVYRIDLATKRIKMLDRGLRFPNRTTFRPGDDLHPNEKLSGAGLSAPYYAQGSFGPRNLYGGMIDLRGPPGLSGPDGMKFGDDGYLYVTVFGQGDVAVLALEGAAAGRIGTVGRLPTHVAFGPAGSQTIRPEIRAVPEA